MYTKDQNIIELWFCYCRGWAKSGDDPSLLNGYQRLLLQGHILEVQNAVCVTVSYKLVKSNIPYTV